MYDESNGSGSDPEVEDLRFTSCSKTHLKFPDIKSIWGFYAIDLKGEKVKGHDWCCVL